ncbi:MAG: hypothetical protein JWO56_3550 [Acidobacteria bacterium]|nr:hypothetical protein [Acidobacteriota bacterium]
MSYLASIVARATGSTPLLQPRIASRYEQAFRGGDTAPAEVAVEREAAPPVARVAPAVPIAGATRREPSPKDAPPLAPRETPRAGEPITPRDTTSLREPPAPPHERIVERETQRIELQEPVIRSVAAAAPLAQPALRPPIESVRREEPRTDRNDERESADDAPLRALLRPPPLPPQAPAAERRGQAPAAAEIHESAPTIRVTIGRVDVRAVEPQSSSRPAPPVRTPAFTHDDYVRLRKDGRR